MSQYRSIFLEPNWALSRYYGWREERPREGVAIFSKRTAPFDRRLVLSELSDGHELDDLLRSLRSADGLTHDILLHDFANVFGLNGGGAGMRFVPLAPADRVLNVATYVVDLTQSEEQLLAAMSMGCRRRVRHAMRDNIEVIAEDRPSAERVDQFLDEFARMARDRNLRLPDRSVLRQMFADGRAMLFSTGSDGTPTIFVMTYRAGDKAIWLHGTGRGKTGDAGQILQWRVMLTLQEMGVRWYDFGGVVSDEQNGIRQFKKSFGGEFVDLGREYAARSSLARLARASIAGVRRVRGQFA